MSQLSQENVIAIWLNGELRSVRFSSVMRDIIGDHSGAEDFILNPDLNDELENAKRKNLLYAYRPYLDEEKLFESVSWHEEKWTVSQALSKLRYMDYSYWNEISQQTSDPRIAARTINQNIEVFGVSNAGFMDAATMYLSGTNFPPVIALKQRDSYHLLEGHLRMTALALAELQDTSVSNREITVVYGERISKNT